MLGNDELLKPRFNTVFMFLWKERCSRLITDVVRHKLTLVQ